MFCTKNLNDKINHIHERALRLVYLDYTSSFEEFFEKDNSVTIHIRNLRSLAIEMFKVVKGIGPEIVKDLFQFDLIKEVIGLFSGPMLKMSTLDIILFVTLEQCCGTICSQWN